MRVKQRRYLAILLAMAMVVSSMFTGYGSGVQVKAEGERAFKGFRFEAGAGNTNNWRDRAILNYNSKNAIKKGTYSAKVVSNLEAKDTRYCLRFGQQSTLISGAFGYAHGDSMGWYVQVFNNGNQGIFTASNPKEGEGALPIPKKGEEITSVVDYDLENGTVSITVNGIPVTFTDKVKEDMTAAIKKHLSAGGSVGFSASEYSATVRDSIDILDVTLPNGIAANPDWTKKDNWDVISIKKTEVFRELEESGQPTAEPSIKPDPTAEPNPTKEPEEGDNLPTDPEWMQIANWEVVDSDSSAETAARVGIANLGEGLYFGAGKDTGNAATTRSIIWYKTDKKAKRGVFSADITPTGIYGLSLRFGVVDELTNATFGWNSTNGWHIQVFNNGNKGITPSGSDVPAPKVGETVNLKVSMNLEAGTVSAYVDDVVVFTDKQISGLKEILGEGGSVGFGLSTGDGMTISNVEFPEDLGISTKIWSNLENWNITSKGETFESRGMRSLAFFGDSKKNASVMYKPQVDIAKGTVKTDVTINETGKTSIVFGYKNKDNYSALSYDAEKKWYLENITNGTLTKKDLSEPSDLIMTQDKATNVKLVFDESKDMVSVTINNKSLCGNQFGGEILEGITSGKMGFMLNELSTLYIDSYSYENESWNAGEEVIRPNKIKTIQSDKMQVTLDEEFPSIIKYIMDGSTFYGQQEKLTTIQINSADIVPTVQSEFKNNEAIYNLVVKDEASKIDAKITIKVSVENNILTYQVTNVENVGTEIRTIYIPNLSPVSVRSTQENATFAGSTMTTDIAKKSDEYVDVDVDYIADTKENKGYMYAFVSSNDLSAAIYSTSEANGGSTKWGRVLRNSYISQDEKGTSYVSIALNSSPWDYQHESQDKTDKEMYTELQSASTSELNQDDMYFKVILTGNINGDDKVDWQDGAIAYREIMHIPFGSEEIPDQVAQRIVENFGSTAAHPFLKTADNLKRVALSTDGLGQRILIKGYASEGHDSAHPDYYDINKRAGGVEDLNVLTDEAKKYNAAIGVHVNATEMYPEADSFGQILTPGGYNWDWIDSAYFIDTKEDLNAGTRYDRLKKFKELVPDLNFIYVDVWYNDNWEAYHLAEQIQSLGWAVATEWAYAMEGNSLWSHWANDLPYGGTNNKGINSDIARFISNHQRDVWMQADIAGYQPLLGGAHIEGFEGWNNRNTNMNYNNYIKTMFSDNLPTKFIQHFEVSSWINDEKGKEREITLKSADGTHTVVTKRNGNDDTSRIITLDGKKVLIDNTSTDRKYLIPWTWNEEDEQKLYHWNTKAEESNWELPADWSGYTNVKMYRLTDTGRTEETIVEVKNGIVKLTAEANTGYVIIPGDKESKQITVEYGVGSHFIDPGFNNMGEKGWTTTGTGAIFDRKEPYNDPRVVFSNNSADASVSQVIKDLIPGKQYTALVYVDNKDEDKKASLKVTIGDEVHEVYTYKTIGPNVVKSDAHHTLGSDAAGLNYAEWQGRMNTMQVSFTAPEEGIDAVLSLTCDEGISAAYFDDVRVVESASNYYPNSELIFEQDFENNEKGLYPFVTSYGSGVTDNYTHLSEKHAPYTSKGNKNNGVDVNLINDVINGDWSLKLQGIEKTGLIYQTIPQNLRFEPNVTYRVSFKYETGTSGHFTFVVGDGDYANNKEFSQTFPMVSGEETQICTFEVTGSESGQTWIGLMSNPKGIVPTKAEKATGKYNFVLDDLKVEKLVNLPTIKSIESTTVETVVNNAPTLPEKVTVTYTDGKTEEVEVKWDAIDPSEYETKRTFDVKGSVAGTDIKAVCTVNVIAEPVDVDRTKLQQLVEKQYNETEYTADSWKVYEEKLNAARSILIKEDATQAEIDTAAKELKAAIEGLVKAGNPTEEPTKNPDITPTPDPTHQPTEQPTNPPAPPIEVPTQDPGTSVTPAPDTTATPQPTITPVPTEKPEATATPVPTEKPQEDLLNQIKVSSKRTVYVGGSKNTAAVAPKIPSGLTSVKEFSGDEDEVLVSYRSSNIKVVTVSNRGKLTAKKAGSAVITVTAKLADGQTKTFKQNVTVKKASLKFTKSASTITLGKKATFTIALYGYDKSDIVWSTTKKDKAAVAKNKGKVTVGVTGKTAGKDTVAVTVKDSKGKSVTLKKAVTVK